MEELEAALKLRMIAAQAGDEAAYAELLRALSDHLRGFFRRRLSRDPDSVEDLVQETLIAVHNQRHTWEAGEPFTPWLHAIAKYKLIDQLRRIGRRAEESLPDDPAFAAMADTTTEAATAQRDVARLLAALPDRFRLPLEYVKLEGLSVEEAATRTGMSISAIKIGIHRGMKTLAQRLRSSSDADR